MENKPQALGVRPPLLTILCVAGLMGSFLIMITVISPPVQAHGRLYAIYLSFSTVYWVICIIGLCLMERWGLWMFIPYLFVDFGIYWYLGLWAPAAIILKGAILVVGLIYYRRLKR